MTDPAWEAMSAFDRFLATNKSHAQIQEIYRTKEKMGIADNDALWTILIMTTPVMELPGLIETQIVAVKAMSDTFMASLSERAQTFSDLIEKIFNDGAEAGDAAVARNASETADKAVGLLAVCLPAHLSAMSQPIVALLKTHGAAITTSALAIVAEVHERAQASAVRAEARSTLPHAVILTFMVSLFYVAGLINGVVTASHGQADLSSASRYFEAALPAGLGFPLLVGIGLFGLYFSAREPRIASWYTWLCSLLLLTSAALMVIFVEFPIVDFYYLRISPPA